MLNLAEADVKQAHKRFSPADRMRFGNGRRGMERVYNNADEC
jgi:hypothetical protein